MPPPPPPPFQPLTSPSEPTSEVIDELCQAAGFLGIGVAAGMLVAGLFVGLLIGFFIGRRSAKAKKKKEKKDGASGADLAKAMGVDSETMEAFENEEEEEEEEKEEDESISQLERDFLSMMATPGLDDHPEIVVNPIIMYKVKIAKEEDRIAKLLDALLEAARSEDAPPIEGVTLPTPEELAQMTPQEKANLAAMIQSGGNVVVKASSVGSVAGKTRRYAQGTNSTKLLVNAGAKFSSVRTVSREGAEETAAKELRERLRVIDQHLQHRLKIDVTKVAAKGSKTRVGPKGFVVDAYQKAKDTKEEPFGGAAHKRAETVAMYAARGRKRVGPPLDHMMSAGQRQALGGGGRRASCGMGSAGGVRRASCAKNSNGGGGAPDEALAGKLANASDMLGA